MSINLYPFVPTAGGPPDIGSLAADLRRLNTLIGGPMFQTFSTQKAPAVAHHAVETFGGKIFVHGGQKEPGGKPVRELWKYYVEKDLWEKETNEGPRLSHHVCFSEEDKLLHFVGGYDGKYRVPDIWTYDYRSCQWIEGVVKGFPSSGGLSSHSVTRAYQPGSVVVIGRLGGARELKKTTAAMKLSRGKKYDWYFSDLPVKIHSRSGHTATAMDQFELVLMGGAQGKEGAIDDEVVVPGMRLLETAGLDFHKMKDRSKRRRSRQRRQHLAEVEINDRETPVPYEWRRQGDGKRRIVKCPARRHHIAVSDGEGTIIVHGGQPLSTPRGETQHVFSDLWVYRRGEWKELYTADCPALTGHKSVYLDGSVVVLGGFDENGMPSGNAYQFDQPIYE